MRIHFYKLCLPCDTKFTKSVSHFDVEIFQELALTSRQNRRISEEHVILKIQFNFINLTTIINDKFLDNIQFHTQSQFSQQCIIKHFL